MVYTIKQTPIWEIIRSVPVAKYKKERNFGIHPQFLKNDKFIYDMNSNAFNYKLKNSSKSVQQVSCSLSFQ